jgi:hypothetical protein
VCSKYTCVFLLEHDKAFKKLSLARHLRVINPSRQEQQAPDLLLRALVLFLLEYTARISIRSFDDLIIV